jgi:hypothetical protein
MGCGGIIKYENQFLDLKHIHDTCKAAGTSTVPSTPESFRSNAGAPAMKVEQDRRGNIKGSTHLEPGFWAPKIHKLETIR